MWKRARGKGVVGCIVIVLHANSNLKHTPKTDICIKCHPKIWISMRDEKLSFIQPSAFIGQRCTLKNSYKYDA